MTDQPRRLQSYLSGHWQAGQGEGSPLRDAATGEVVAHVGSEGLDLAGALDYGRRAGGEALRAMTFHERALMLKALALELTQHKEAFYAESLRTGATKIDGMVDIDGGIGTLFVYASKGRRELPNATLLLDGPPEGLSKDNTFSAQHVLTPLTGVALHINAFNFPVWGMLEKLAPNLLAGMPAIVKPASQTAYLTEMVARVMIDSGILPEGAVQVVCGGVGDMLDHVTGQDVVTFTGSASTGRMLKAHPRIVAEGARFSMEADSLNCAILGPDAEPGRPEFDLFVKEVHREMTVKAGQKCTAIRRAFVPKGREEAVIEALAARLAKTAVGLPSEEGTRMGALASLAQRDEVRARIADLAAEAQIVAGDPGEVHLSSGDAEKGAFLNPVLLHCADAMRAGAVHDVEAFGPVATIMGYDGAGEVVALAAKGKGSLAASVFTDDADFSREVVIGMAPHHGRILIGNRDSAKSSTGHGSPMPGLVHGGPGRAGGGEELGGIRGVKHYMQRTAVQGAPRLLAPVVGRWIEGGGADPEAKPFRKTLEELRIGDRIETAEREITIADIEAFAALTGDNFYAHMNEEQAAANPFFDGRVAHGYGIISFAAGLFVDPDPGPVLANYGIDNLRFLTPVYPGDRIKVRLTVKEITPRATADHGEVRWDAQVTTQEGAVAATYDVLTMVAKGQG